MDTHQGYRSGFIGIIGRPNVGKSTLLNRLAGMKLAITSDKPQTTRNRIRAVVTGEEAQLVFVDTPGFHKPREALGEKLNAMVLSTLRDVDVILFVLDGAQTIGKGDLFIAGELDKADTAAIASSIERMVEEVRAYVRGYRLKQEVQFDRIGSDNAMIIPGVGAFTGVKTSVFLEIEGSAHYLPAYAGNLDIMTSAALSTGERLAEQKWS